MITAIYTILKIAGRCHRGDQLGDSAPFSMVTNVLRRLWGGGSHVKY